MAALRLSGFSLRRLLICSPSFWSVVKNLVSTHRLLSLSLS